MILARIIITFSKVDQMLLKKFFLFFRNIKILRKYFYNGEKFIDREIESYLDFDNGFFVELGANDGKNQSNSLYFEKYRNWNGVLIEPSPNNFINCLKNRSPRTLVFCNACVPFDFEQKYVDMCYDNLMTLATNVERDTFLTDEKIINAARPAKKVDIKYRYGAIPATLNSILKTSKAPNYVDLLSLDVEGAEIDVLKGINHDEYRFKYILVECRNIARMSDYLEKIDYKLVKKINSHDYLFIDYRSHF